MKSTIPELRRVLFLCTGNSCRSQMAEALLRHLGAGSFEAHSAGSHPAGFIHPLAIECMNRMNVIMDGQSSKSWNDVSNLNFDVVITLCDSAAEEACPVWPGAPFRVHWSLPDPTYYMGSTVERIEFAMRIAGRLRTKIEGLLAIDWSLGREPIQKRLEFLGEI